eukprot:CAMPEP_0185848230 /NCGR_PEP_ID=MMETSP1354-20130828/3193_1 /TAXON_ID=708628 /ORGANISM="Erythrolobus madagascarensis, Strain CCMP3276" /LENGTH=666 /DNA_ID=CAMNT_0028548607 /DNA_START=225 /DNA_END=2225 /DNA_ORIENTATION=+
MAEDRGGLQDSLQNAQNGEEGEHVVVFNSLSRSKERLVGRGPNQRSLTWYMCGPTVYDVSHVGHARNYVSFDIIRRVLEDVFGYDITLQMNVTDIDDKIIARSNENSEPFVTLSRRMEHAFFTDLKNLRCRPPTVVTRVSEYIPDVVKYIDSLIQRGFAYAVPSGSVYFDSGAFKSAGYRYAKLEPLSAGNLELLREGEGALSTAAAALGDGKKAAADFALWKASKPGEPVWDCSWSANPGRPGWHIECSAMASTELGCPIDMHSGGVDLKFPHHDNEIAQAEAYHECHDWVRYWLHSGHLHIEGLKMSKSLKNFISIEKCLERYSAAQLRILFLLHKYDAPMNYSEEGMLEAVRLHRTFVDFDGAAAGALRDVSRLKYADVCLRPTEAERELLSTLAKKKSIVRAALADNFNTPDALLALVSLVGAANGYLAAIETREERRYVDANTLSAVLEYVRATLNVFGVETTAASDGGDGGLVEQVLDVFGDFRMSVRNKALETAGILRAGSSDGRGSEGAVSAAEELVKEVLGVCDRVRDENLPRLGVRLEDKADGSFVWKREDAIELMREVERKKAAEEEKRAEKERRRREEEEKAAKELELAKLSPEVMFKEGERANKYSKWDEQGVPTHDKEGNEISKSAKKKLLKDRERQTKLHTKYLEQLQQTQ